MKARLEITTRLRNGHTVLGPTFFSAPFKLADISEPGATHRHLMIMNASPGVLDGDEYEINITLADGCSVLLETQSYQRLYPMPNGAVQHTRVELGAGSTLSYLPQPTVPHAGARFAATNKIFLGHDSKLCWGEVITPGRGLHNERFRYHSFRSCTEVYLGGQLAVKDNLVLYPTLLDLQGPGQLEGFTHQASLLLVGPAGWAASTAAGMLEMIDGDAAVTGGLSRLPVPGLAVRLLGFHAEPLFLLLQQLAAYFAADKTKVYAH